MEGSGLYTGDKFHHGGIVRVKFAHHRQGKPGPRRELNVDMLVARLIIGKMESLAELSAVYSLQDAYYLDEVLDLKEEAEYLQAKAK